MFEKGLQTLELHVRGPTQVSVFSWPGFEKARFLGSGLVITGSRLAGLGRLELHPYRQGHGSCSLQ